MCLVWRVLVSVVLCLFFFFKQKTAYEMRISDWSSDVCSSDLLGSREDARTRRNDSLPFVLSLSKHRPFSQRGRKDGPSTSSGRTERGGERYLFVSLCLRATFFRGIRHG